jgi:hypothetical protein
VLRSLPDYDRVFAPKLAGGPSGLADPPRPFVVRAAHLDGTTIPPDSLFHLDVNVFDAREQLRDVFARAFSELAHAGLGTRRARFEPLSPPRGCNNCIDLLAREPARAVTVFFRTPTELKGACPPGQIPFGVLFSRLRDRIATLSSLYGQGPLEIDFRAMADRAALVRMTRCDLRYGDISRWSSRTGNVHGIGGFTGLAQYEGDLTEFVPWMRAAWWTGVGRHTVWGNGVIESDFRE